ncbi:MAG: roadblock/LC7 domain-containing protein, partial [Candidatus Obscuribacterales bacterium]|nr:roadblock/LC7 domain-containing protein [Candidatus Obscuribacterales bacterium]
KDTVEGLLSSLDEEKQEADSDEDDTSATSASSKANKKLKEFGRLSSKSAAPQKSAGDNEGTMKTIGKLLIDKQAVENIINAGENRKIGEGLATARVISAARGKGISELLTKIDQYTGVAGSIIVGHDGLVMASTLKEGWDKDMMGALSTALLSTSNLITKKLEIGKLRQMVMLTSDEKDGQLKNKTTVLTDVDVGILAVFLEQTNIEQIDGLLDTIQKTIHG